MTFNFAPAELKRRQSAERSKRYRARCKLDGKLEVRIRVLPQHKAAIKQLAKELNQLGDTPNE